MTRNDVRIPRRDQIAVTRRTASLKTVLYNGFLAYPEAPTGLPVREVVLQTKAVYTAVFWHLVDQPGFIPHIMVAQSPYESAASWPNLFNFPKMPATGF
jgi:hypothetical protein